MKRKIKIISLSVFICLQFLVFSQTNNITVKGVVYMNSSRSQGILNGKTFTDSQHTFRNQIIYFKKDSILVNTTTNSEGSYTLVLTPGTYDVFQAEGLKNNTKGLARFGTDIIVVKNDGGPYDIFFNNHVNGRSVSGGAIPDGKVKNTTSKKNQKIE